MNCFFFIVFWISSGATSIDRLFVYFLIAAAFVFLAVTGFITYILFKYRAKADDSGKEPVQIHGNNKVEISLTLLATGLVGFFFYLTLSTMLSINEPAGNKEPDLIITAHQWWWDAEYPETGAVTANEIHIPTGKKILVYFRSADVVHDWWVPDLGRKMDIIPGKTNHLWIEVDKPGTYLGACSEFCGVQHAWMRIRVIAQSSKEFLKWQQRQAESAAVNVADDSMATIGGKIFNEKTCGNCHSVRGTEADGKIGPDLTHVAARRTLLTGKITNTRENMYRWIDDPQKIKEGANMHSFILEKRQLNALVTFLEGLK